MFCGAADVFLSYLYKRRGERRKREKISLTYKREVRTARRGGVRGERERGR